MSKPDIPRKSVYRLSIYQRCLQKLEEYGEETVSSEALAKAAGVKSTQLRKDLAYFGQFGTRGIGYSVPALKSAIDEVLGTAKLKPVVLIGVGNLGAALLHYDGFRKEGFEISAAFDVNPELALKRLTGKGPPLHDQSELKHYLEKHQVKMAILTVPGIAAQSVTNDLVTCGIQGILNFSPVVLQVPDDVIVHHVNLAVELENLSYFVR